MAYFGNYLVWGERGLLVLEDTEAKLGIARETLAQAESQEEKLFHRIQLMEGDHVHMPFDQYTGTLLYRLIFPK